MMLPIARKGFFLKALVKDVSYRVNQHIRTVFKNLRVDIVIAW